MSDGTTVSIEEKRLLCGLIMPISECDGLPPSHWEDVRKIITDAVDDKSNFDFDVRLVSDDDVSGVIQKRIIQNVYNDSIVICDVSGRNPNVLFELGMRIAFDRPTIIIKDDHTPFIFDTGMIDHIQYPRDLRHNLVEVFKSKLVTKLDATHEAHEKDPASASILKAFGTFKVVKLDQENATGEQAILAMLNNLSAQMSRLNVEAGRRNTAEHANFFATAPALSRIIDEEIGRLPPDTTKSMIDNNDHPAWKHLRRIVADRVGLNLPARELDRLIEARMGVFG